MPGRQGSMIEHQYLALEDLVEEYRYQYLFEDLVEQRRMSIFRMSIFVFGDLVEQR